MGELNIDASLVKGSALVQAEERLVELTNGCICCTLRGDLAAEVGRLAAEGVYDYCVIESTGIGEPMQVRPLFHLHLRVALLCEAGVRGCGWPGRLVVQADWLCRLSNVLLIFSLSLLPRRWRRRL